jgi:hypothetical protein
MFYFTLIFVLVFNLPWQPFKYFFFASAPYVPRAKLDGAEEGRRKDSRKEHHKKMPMRGQDWSNQVRQTVVPPITSKPHDNKAAASKKPHFFTKREITWTEVVAIVKAFECMLDHTNCYPETSKNSNIFAISEVQHGQSSYV